MGSVQLPKSVVHDKIVGRGGLDTKPIASLIRVRANQHHVMAVVHDRACQAYGIARTTYSGDGPTGAVSTHDGGVQFRVAIGIEHGATAGIEQFAILQLPNREFDGINGVGAVGQGLPCRNPDCLQGSQVVSVAMIPIRHIAGAAVDRK